MFLELLKRANTVIFAFSSAAFHFCSFYEVLGFNSISMLYVNCFVYSTLSNLQFAIDWLRDPNFSQISKP